MADCDTAAPDPALLARAVRAGFTKLWLLDLHLEYDDPGLAAVARAVSVVRLPPRVVQQLVQDYGGAGLWLLSEFLRLPRPTRASPGSRAKVDEMSRRAAGGKQLWHEDDVPMDGDGVARVADVNPGNHHNDDCRLVEGPAAEKAYREELE